MKVSIKKIVALILIAGFNQQVLALTDQVASDKDSWQMRLIYQPGAVTLERERNGFVMIYDGFNDLEVNTIMDDKFNRIENMMFTRVKLTGNNGQVLKDPVTGDELVEEDGCDD